MIKKVFCFLFFVFCLINCSESLLKVDKEFVVEKAKTTNNNKPLFDKSDLIIVLGHRLNPDGSPSFSLRTRMKAALNLKNSLKKPIFILSGKGVINGLTEAEVMSEWLQKKGVSKDQIICEDKSMNTIENAKFTKKIIDGLSFNSISLLTSSYHIKRANRIFLAAFGKELSFTPYSAEKFIR